jgi:hypothetical protein
VRASVPKFVGVSVSCPKRKKSAKRANFLNFSFLAAIFDVFSSLRLSLTKKRKFFFTPVRRKSQSLSFASRASEYTRA